MIYEIEILQEITPFIVNCEIPEPSHIHVIG